MVQERFPFDDPPSLLLHVTLEDGTLAAWLYRSDGRRTLKGVSRRHQILSKDLGAPFVSRVGCSRLCKVNSLQLRALRWLSSARSARALVTDYVTSSSPRPPGLI